MNKYQEALDNVRKVYVESNHYDEEDIRLLQELVDKETPKKPIKVNVADDPSVREGSLAYIFGHKYYCPNCNKFLCVSNVDISRFCKHCGQRLE